MKTMYKIKYEYIDKNELKKSKIEEPRLGGRTQASCGACNHEQKYYPR